MFVLQDCSKFFCKSLYIYGGSKNYPSTLHSSFLSCFMKTNFGASISDILKHVMPSIYAISFSFVFFSIFIFLKNEKIHMNFLKRKIIPTDRETQFIFKNKLFERQLILSWITFHFDTLIQPTGN